MGRPQPAQDGVVIVPKSPLNEGKALSQRGQRHFPIASGADGILMGMADLSALVCLPRRFHAENRSIRDLFGDTESLEVSRQALHDALMNDSTLIDDWQTYSYDKRTSPSPYLDGLAVGFYDGGNRNHIEHVDAVSACCDFIERERAWVLRREILPGE
jgi:hypothetical protein